MSLRGKIVWLFIGVAIVPLLILAAFSHRQSVTVVERAAQARVVADVVRAAGRIADESEAAEEALHLVLEASIGEVRPSLLETLIVGSSEGWPRFQYLRLRGPSGVVLARAGDIPGDTVRCGPAGRRTLVRRVVGPGSDGNRVEGGYWLGHSLDREWSSDLTVLDPAGRVLLSPSCDAPGGLGPRQLEVAATTAASFRIGGDEGGYGGVAPVGEDGWVAVIRRSDSLRAPIGRLFRNYWLFVLGLATATVLAFSMLVGRVTRSIEDLTRAAERVGRGDLRPWLPPPATDEVGRLTLAFSEMTDRLRDTLERVDRSGRLAVVGKLSSYLAHEIRNPLSAVKMNLQRLDRWHRRGELPDRCGEPIRMSLQEVERLQVAVANVLQLSRAPNQPPEIVSLHALVTEAGELLDKELAQRGVELRWELDAEADRVLARPGQLKGVILNLILNAMDAQPDGGRLLIRSRLSPGTSDRPGPRLEVRFLDDGPGVPPEIRARVFEPFFTTKPNGSGIGLAVASQAVRENGGDLFLDEPLTVDQGAEFVVSLPLAAVSPDEEALEEEPELAPWLAEAPEGGEGSLTG